MKSSLGRRIHSSKIVSNLSWSVFRSLLKLDFSSNVRLSTKNSNYTHPLASTLWNPPPPPPPVPRQLPPIQTTQSKPGNFGDTTHTPQDTYKEGILYVPAKTI